MMWPFELSDTRGLGDLNWINHPIYWRNLLLHTQNVRRQTAFFAPPPRWEGAATFGAPDPPQGGRKAICSPIHKNRRGFSFAPSSTKTVGASACPPHPPSTTCLGGVFRSILFTTARDWLTFCTLFLLTAALSYCDLYFKEYVLVGVNDFPH